MTTRTSYLQGLLCSVALIFPTTMVVTTSIATQALAGGAGGNAGSNGGQGGTGGFGGGGGQGGGASNWGGLSDPVNSGGAGLGGGNTQGGGGGGAGVPGGPGGTGIQGGAGGSGGQHGVVNVGIPIGIFPIPTEGGQGDSSAAISAADGGGGGAGGFGAVITGEIVGGMSGPVLVNGAAGGNGGNSVAANIGVGGGGGGGGLGILFLDTVTDFQLNGTVSGAAGGRGGNRLDGGGGGGGGEGVVFAGATNAINLSTEASGGQGGDGGNGGASALYGTGFHGGDGGGAGAGAAFHALANGIVFDGNIIGGAGGNGGAGGDGITGGIFDGAGGDGGSGGAGGEGVVFDARADEIDVNTTISGGSGGDGGQGGAGISGNDGAGGSGGAGGAGIVLMDGGTVTINAAVLGGAGGTGAGSSADGAGGAGITGSNLSIIHSGTISGGLGGDGATRADAITFAGGANRLELQAGSTIVGNVDATIGLNDTLVLGGDTDPANAFDLSDIVPTAPLGATDQFVGFEQFEKTGASTWRLAGTGAQNWSIHGGMLIGNTESLGGDLTFGAGSGTRGVVFDQATNGTYAGVISGEGGLTKTGGGTLTLTADNEVGVFTIHDGTLLIDEGILEQSNTGFQSFIGQNAGDDAELVIANGGAVSTVHTVHVGDAANSQGSVVITGDGSSLDVGDLTVGFGGDGALSVAEGGHLQTVRFMNVGGGNYGRQGTGILSISGADSRAEIGTNLVVAGLGDGSTGHVTIADGGVLHVGADVWMGWGNASGSASLNIGAASSDAADAVAAGRLVAGQVQFYTDSASLNFNHTDSAHTFDADLASAGGGAGFINHYSGTTTLTGNSSGFSGDTIIHGGTLSVGSTLGGTVRVEDGGTLGGSGTVGTTTIASGGTLAPGSSIGTLTIDGDLTLNDGAFLDYELGNPGASAALGASDRIDVNRNLVLNGTLNLAQSDDLADGTAGLGYYRLMTYRGDLFGDGLAIGDIPTLADPALYEIQTSAGNVDLFIGAMGNDDLQHWQGGDGVWNTANQQWLNRDGDLPVAWAGNHAVFKNEPGGFNGGTIDVQGAQSFAGLQFVDEGYRLEGTGALETIAGGSEIRVLADSAEIATEITGAGGITKTQGGTLILSGQNSYEGGTIIAGGAVQVGEDANLGDALGGLLLDGGTLRITGTAYASTDRAITIGAGGGGFDIAAVGNAFGLGQDIVGGGDLIKRGEGALRLTGANAYGNTLVQEGWLIGDAGSISGDIANAGIVSFQQGTNASFSGDIVGFGGTDGMVIKDGAGTLMLEGLSNLDWTIAAGELVTEAARFGGDVRLDGAATLLSFADGANATYAGVISGNGRFSLDGEGTVLLTGDSSSFAGRTAINAGMLLVGDAADNGALGGSLDVLNGSTLGGSGTVGSGTGSLVTIASGGTLSPGNSIGTLTVDGDLVFDAGARFAIEVNPEGTEGDLVAVTGNATLHGGSVAHIGADGNYDLRSTYTILSADGTLSGAFEGVTSDFAFLNPDLLYDYGAGTVGLKLVRNDRDFASAAYTPNQIATAVGIETIGFDAGHPVYDAIAQLAVDDDLIRASFDALSGEIHASMTTALIEDSRFIRNAANDRIRAAFATAGASYAPVLAYGPGDTPVLVAADHGGPVFWSHGFGSWGSTDSDGNAASLDRSTGGLLVGTDTLVGDWRVGVLAGYSHSRFDANDRAAAGASDNYHLGLYGGTQWGDIAFRTGAAYTWHDIGTNRVIAIPGLADSLGGNYSAGAFQAFGELGYSFEIDSNTRLDPFANLAHVSLHTDSFTEQGGAAALSANSGRTDVTFTTLGLRGEHAMTLGTVDATLQGMVGWQHAFGDTTPDSIHAFSAGNAFSIAGAPIARDSAVIEAGLDLNLTPEATFGLSYTGQIASDAYGHGFKANLAVRF